MTIQRNTQGNQHRSGKLEARGSGKLIPLDDRSAAARHSKNMWIFLGVMALALIVAFYAPSTPTSDRADRQLTDAEKCAGLTGPECLEKLSLERRRREFVESPEGQEFLRATDAVNTSEK